ncbi:MAG TPA: DUF5996 family protein [Burkholderiales bacterium]|nr:DUF5996 family protein [Burkholderiales bacterium]
MSIPRVIPNFEPWPALPYDAWRDTCATLHRWTQIVGKARLALTPWINHSWHATFYVNAHGLTTSPIPYGPRVFEVDFDFIDHALLIRVSDAREQRLALKTQSVADFYAAFMSALNELNLNVSIHGAPNEVADAIPFDQDRIHTAYDPQAAQNFWRVLLQIDRVFKLFRTGYVGKVSPIHLFWGSFDMAVTRFSGRRAPPHPGGVPALPDLITREAYSHEVSSAGFWPGGGAIDYPAFYSYAYPTPPGFDGASVEPKEAFFHPELGEFILAYDAVRGAAAPDDALLAFLQSTYEAAADLAHWDRASLECTRGQPGVVRGA